MINQLKQVEAEIDKFISFKKDRKDNSFYFNSKISAIKKQLADDFETIDFQNELFKIIKYMKTVIESIIYNHLLFY